MSRSFKHIPDYEAKARKGKASAMVRTKFAPSREQQQMLYELRVASFKARNEEALIKLTF